MAGKLKMLSLLIVVATLLTGSALAGAAVAEPPQDRDPDMGRMGGFGMGRMGGPGMGGFGMGRMMGGGYDENSRQARPSNTPRQNAQKRNQIAPPQRNARQRLDRRQNMPASGGRGRGGNQGMRAGGCGGR